MKPQNFSERKAAIRRYILATLLPLLVLTGILLARDASIHLEQSEVEKKLEVQSFILQDIDTSIFLLDRLFEADSLLDFPDVKKDIRQVRYWENDLREAQVRLKVRHSENELAQKTNDLIVSGLAKIDRAVILRSEIEELHEMLAELKVLFKTESEEWEKLFEDQKDSYERMLDRIARLSAPRT